MSSMLLIVLLMMTMMVLSSSFIVRVSSHMRRINNSKLYMNEFARNEPTSKTASDEEIKETKELIIKKELEEKEEISKSMRDKLLKEIRDGGGDANYSKGILIYYMSFYQHYYHHHHRHHHHHHHHHHYHHHHHHHHHHRHHHHHNYQILGAVAGNPILIISFVVAALAVASYAIGAL